MPPRAAPFSSTTGRGTCEPVAAVVPLPSCPTSLAPQQRAVPSASTAQVELCATVSLTMLVKGSPFNSTVCGVRAGSAPGGSCPSWPLSLLPQQTAVPPFSSAQLWPTPSASCSMPESVKGGAPPTPPTPALLPAAPPPSPA